MDNKDYVVRYPAKYKSHICSLKRPYRLIFSPKFITREFSPGKTLQQREADDSLPPCLKPYPHSYGMCRNITCSENYSSKPLPCLFALVITSSQVLQASIFFHHSQRFLKFEINVNYAKDLLRVFTIITCTNAV